jgi:glycosyltransferase involved in cell wall biosynthesis
MKVSFAITTHNEAKEFSELIQSLLTQLQNKKLPYDHEIVVLDDMSTDPEILKLFTQFANVIKLVQKPFAGDFSEHKNYLSSQCSGDWIFQLDADELPPYRLIESLPEFLDANPLVDVYGIPRINTVWGLTEQHIAMWGWKLSSSPKLVREELLDIESRFFDLLHKNDMVMNFDASGGGRTRVKYLMPIVNFPDYQRRLWKNNSGIHWVGRVHEMLEGYKVAGTVPPVMELAIHHHKNIAKQERQNQMYANIRR